MVGRRSALAKGLQRELKVPERGSRQRFADLRAPPAPSGESETDGGMDRWAAVRTTSAIFPGWCRPSCCRYPSNIPGGPGHNWANGVSMATPIAHKGVVAGAKVQAMTMLDILLHPELVRASMGLFHQRPNQGQHYQELPAS